MSLPGGMHFPHPAPTTQTCGKTISCSSANLKTILDTSNTTWKVTFFVNETDRGGFFDSGNTLLNTRSMQSVSQTSAGAPLDP